MRTLLSQFCDDFEGIVRPLLEPLERTTLSLAEASQDVPGKTILPGLQDVRHQFGVLVEKVVGQQAYVLIFGPLKSGKSTLMNALSAAYVSEVTSLPAYPCMVYVSHSPHRQYKLTRYNGRVETLTDPAQLRSEINRAHTELAVNIRVVEEKGGSFDPQVHYPDAIRRIDVQVPAGELDHSGAVLVDTPGLYSRMKFGYDHMTKEFRNAAACGIFVVKSDNLFLEQVFQEFNELLKLFSRIFLLVNLDSSKKDLQPDGSLVPSLENSNPERIIQAFENLAMSAPIKAAAEEGRLRIYPVDLLLAASQRLKVSRSRSRVDPRKAAQAPEAEHGLKPFQEFSNDLTEYLNSTDYMLAFLGDSMRQAGSLLSELRTLCAHEDVRALAQKVEVLDAERRDAEGRRTALERLKAFDWEGELSALRVELAAENREQARQVESKTERALVGAIDAWFQKDASLQALLDHEVAPLFKGFQDELALLLHRALGERVSAGFAGLALNNEIRTELRRAGLDLAALGRGALDGLRPEDAGREVDVFLRSTDVPVRKGFWDWILFRSQSTMQRRLFGAPDKPTRAITKGEKARRLGQPARQAMGKALDEFNGSTFPESADHVAKTVLGRYADAVVESVRGELEVVEMQLSDELEALRKRLRVFQKLQNHLVEMQASVERTHTEVERLKKRYAKADPKDLIKPYKGSGRVERKPAVTEPERPGASVRPGARPAPRATPSGPGSVPGQTSKGTTPKGPAS